ncbi:MAG TPA: type VI secretion system-associated protein TagF [Steroidobacteraceae bacterium]|nr:type VI secretion system-associated protein TagF [Steroidobacteraceae bacterium]
MPVTSETGFYGKLPCRGDFMQRRAPQAFVDTWDAWLSECLHVSRQQLTERWLDMYLTSPVWRFVLAEGICGEGAYAGVMLPSVDRVGRYFPLTIVSPLEPGSCILEAACGTGRAWFDAAEELALRALDAGDLDLQAFDAQVDALPGLGACSALGESNQLMELIAQSGFPRRGAPSHISMLGESPQRAVNAIASLELQKAFRPCALWWTQGSEAVQPGWLVTSGLPAPSGYVAMLSGQWRAAGWNSVELTSQMHAQMNTQEQEQEQGAPPATAVSAAIAPEAPQPFDLQIVAAHSPPRHGVRASLAARYVMRPDTGLWGMAVAVDGNDPGARADLIADVTQDLAPQATLTTRIESARRALQRVLAPGTGVILFLTEQTEYAVMWSGAVQGVLLRGGNIVELVGGGSTHEADVPMQREDSGTGDGGLLALLSAPATREAPLSVHYGGLEANDLWVLGSEGSIPDTLADAAGDPSAPCNPQKVLDVMLARHAPAKSVAESPPSLMLIAAQPAGPTVT